MQGSSLKDPQIRLFIACPRSGSTLLMRIFAESPECAVTSRLTMTTGATVGIPLPKYSRLKNADIREMVRSASNSGKNILICKEEPCNDREKSEYSYELLSNAPECAATRPIFLIRDPIRVFDSWKKLGWTDVQSFLDCFNNLFAMLKQTDSSLISCLLYEQLTQQPRREIERICLRWGIPFSENLLEFSSPFGTSFLHNNLGEKHASYHSQPELFSTAKNNSTIVENAPCHGLVTNDEKSIIEKSLGESYLACWRQHILHLRDILGEKQWIGFDLDDTLHEFRRASSAASNRVLEAIQEHYGVPFAELKSQYSEVLRASTSNAFSDGKLSSEYRRDRFLAVANHFSLSLSDSFLTQLLHLYEATLKESLELKSGALSLLKEIKCSGKKVVILTEGPQDAQKWTVENLGISPYIDFIATTNYFKVTKTDGLFTQVLETLRITPSEIAYVGDNENRDMIPAIAEGIFSLHFAEGSNCNLEIYPPRINTLNKLKYIFSHHTKLRDIKIKE
ncbi:HAD-like domain-containing protein [Xylaria arbuscula]|nr:HAD-like domain-containing protein [Xylaria arbuscula]